jgi:hypothetical protein
VVAKEEAVEAEATVVVAVETEAATGEGVKEEGATVEAREAVIVACAPPPVAAAIWGSPVEVEAAAETSRRTRR